LISPQIAGFLDFGGLPISQLVAERRRNMHSIAGENPGNLFAAGSSQALTES
jgi:hypothetical protein